MTYDLIVIGGGPAGYCAAGRAGHAGMNTLLVEKRTIGGVCLNEGCIPTKTLLYSAKLFDNARGSEKYGVTVQNASLDHRTVLARKNKVVKTLVAGVMAELRKQRVTVEDGKGVISGKSDEGYLVTVGDQTFTGKRLLLATGSTPGIPGITGMREGLERGFVLTNREILNLEAVPASLAVIGGGIIGLELASYFNSAESKVTVIELLGHCAGSTDREISGLLVKNYEKKGIDFKLNTEVIAIARNSVVFQSNGKEFSLPVEKVLLSVGRMPVTEGLGLSTIGVETEDGRIKNDDTGRTNIPNVFAAGDVNGISMLAHTAFREAEVAVNTMLGLKDGMRYHAIPSVIYTNPEVAMVGETEESAREKGITFDVRKLSMRYSGRFLAENEGGDGICKVLVEKKNQTVIGVHMIANNASEIIYGASLMIETEMRVRDIRELVFPHPTVSEIIRETIFTF